MLPCCYSWSKVKRSGDRISFAAKATGPESKEPFTWGYTVKKGSVEVEVFFEDARDKTLFSGFYERAFRCTKTVDLKVRPIFHRLEDRVRAHLLVCMLAYHVEWHMRRDLAPLLFQDDDKVQAAAKRRNVVQKAQRSDRALRKIATKRTAEGDLPVHSLATLLQDLTTIVKDRIRPVAGLPEFDKITLHTPLQRRAFDLLGVGLPL